MSRCTNEFGDLQPTMLKLAQLWGDSRQPRIPAAEIEKFWESAAIMEFLSNPIQPWKVDRDGSVKDALYVNFKV
jgi:hypothetical protein